MKKQCGCKEPLVYVKPTAGMYAHRRCTGCGQIYAPKILLQYHGEKEPVQTSIIEVKSEY